MLLISRPFSSVLVLRFASRAAACRTPARAASSGSCTWTQFLVVISKSCAVTLLSIFSGSSAMNAGLNSYIFNSTSLPLRSSATGLRRLAQRPDLPVMPAPQHVKPVGAGTGKFHGSYCQWMLRCRLHAQRGGSSDFNVTIPAVTTYAFVAFPGLAYP